MLMIYIFIEVEYRLSLIQLIDILDAESKMFQYDKLWNECSSPPCAL